jgi:hypothetical protein
MKTKITFTGNVLFAIFLVTLLLTAGCNSPPKENAQQTTSTQAAGQENAGQTVTTITTRANAVTTITSTTQTSVNPGAGTDLNAQLKSLLQNGAKDYMAAYDTTMTGSGQNDYKGEMDYYVKADKVRVDTLIQVQGMGESRFYLLSNDYIVCTKQGSDWACIKMPQQDSSKDPNQQSEDIQNSIDKSVVVNLPDRVIAGVPAKCYKITVTATTNDVSRGIMPSGEYVYCISPDGVILYSEGTTGGVHIVQEAKRYTTSVSDSDFVPPSEPKDLTAGMPGA